MSREDAVQEAVAWALASAVGQVAAVLAFRTLMGVPMTPEERAALAFRAVMT